LVPEKCHIFILPVLVHFHAVADSGDRKGESYQDIKHDTNEKDIMVLGKAEQGTSRTYALRRLATDRPCP
jgi:hypothetical protein